MEKGWHEERMILSINECFDALKIIKLLRELPFEQRDLALFLNFTLPKPEVCLVKPGERIYCAYFNCFAGI